MWNMDGLILMGFCEADYEKLRNQMRISFVVYDGYFEKCSKVVNLVINHYDGGYQAGKYFRELGHKKALCIADNFICMDKERIEGFCKAFEPGEALIWQIPKTEKERIYFYQDNFSELLKNNITAVLLSQIFMHLRLCVFYRGKNYISLRIYRSSVLMTICLAGEVLLHLRRFIRMQHSEQKQQ